MHKNFPAPRTPEKLPEGTTTMTTSTHTVFSRDQVYRYALVRQIAPMPGLGIGTCAFVNAVTNASGKILSSVKLEMEYYKMIGQKPELSAILGGGADTKEKPKAKVLSEDQG